jgi:hypothetical protein
MGEAINFTEYLRRKNANESLGALLQGNMEKSNHFLFQEMRYENIINQEKQKRDEERSERVANAIRERKAKGLTIMDELYPERRKEKIERLEAELKKLRGY